MTVGASGELYIADYANSRVRKVALDGTIITIAGNGVAGYSGDGGPATSAALDMPWDVGTDAAGNLYIADYGNSRIRMVDTRGFITTVAGNNTSGYSGDGDLATRAALSAPRGILVDTANSIYVADSVNNAVRLLTPVGAAPVLAIAVTHAGNFNPGQSGTYTLSVTNGIGAAATSGTVTVTEYPPAGLTVASMSGAGWSCTGNSCSRSDALSAKSSYPPVTATVNVDAAAAGQVTNQVSVSGGGSATAGASDLTLIPGKVTAAVNGASFTGSPAPGSVASIFGSNLASATSGATTVPLPLSLAGVNVSVNGIAAPLWYVSPQQINFEMPAEVATGTAAVTVITGAAASTPLSFTAPQVAPGILVYGNNRAVAVNPDYSLTDAAHGAAAGSVITVYLTGIGPVKPAVATNTQAPSQPLCQPSMTASATIGGQNAPVQFIGLTPGGIALAQANITVPSLAAGDYPLVITVGGAASNAPLVAVSGK